MQNTDYWAREGAQKTFTHSLYPEWVKVFDRSWKVLDFGCGYGRLTPELRQYGFHDIIIHQYLFRKR